MSRPQVIDDQEHERVHDRVAAIDVAKDSGMVCARTPHPSRPGARRATVQSVRARMGAVRALGRRLRQDGIEIVTLESTSVLLADLYVILEAAGLKVQLVNARHAKNVPGRDKTDPLTDHLGVSQLAGRVVMGVATVAGHERRRGWPMRSGPAGGAALRVA